MYPPPFSARSYDFQPYTDARSFIGGRWLPLESPAPVMNPRHGEVMGQVSMSGAAAIAAAVAAAEQAQPAWGAAPMRERAQVLYRLKQLMERDLEELSWLLAHENGKTIAQARASVRKGIECVELGASLPNMVAGGQLQVSRGVSCRVVHEPLGIVGGIVPFNFPTMVPLWMLPQALVAGNAFVLKPSEKVPFSMVRVTALLQEAGLPEGVLSLVQGGRAAAEALVEHPAIAAVGFVGSTAVARKVYARGTALGKRMLCLGGAKNHLVVVPDAAPSLTADNIVASFTGCAGQRCMAAAVLLAVGEVEPILDAIKATAAALSLRADVGAIITPQSRERIRRIIDDAEAQGATIALDGRDVDMPGSWLGPTIIDHARPDMPCATEEIFGPVLTILRVPTLDAAIAIENASPYGNAASIYTTSGKIADYATARFEAGMCGVNIGVPVPREPFSFGGWNDSCFGQGDITGVDGFRLWSRPRKITAKWALQRDTTWMS